MDKWNWTTNNIFTIPTTSQGQTSTQSSIIDRDLGHTDTDDVKHVRLRQRTCFSFFKFFNKVKPLIFYCIKQIDYIFPSVCTVIDHRSQKTSQRSACKEQSTVTPLDRLRLVSYFLFFTRCDVICDLYYSKHTRENVIYLWNICILHKKDIFRYFIFFVMLDWPTQWTTRRR